MTSIHRPPTPEPEEPTPAESIRLQLAGERERLKVLLRNRLEECGWKDEVRALARGALCCVADALRCRVISVSRVPLHCVAAEESKSRLVHESDITSKRLNLKNCLKPHQALA